MVGFLVSFSPLKPCDRDPVREGMSEMGFVEGKNMMSESRWAELHYDRLPGLAAELVSRNVDVIVTIAGTLLARAAKNATSTIPIVFAHVGDAVGAGLVASLARPGGNVTGFRRERIARWALHPLEKRRRTPFADIGLSVRVASAFTCCS